MINNINGFNPSNTIQAGGYNHTNKTAGQMSVAATNTDLFQSKDNRKKLKIAAAGISIAAAIASAAYLIKSGKGQKIIDTVKSFFQKNTASEITETGARKADDLAEAAVNKAKNNVEDIQETVVEAADDAIQRAAKEIEEAGKNLIKSTEKSIQKTGDEIKETVADETQAAVQKIGSEITDAASIDKAAVKETVVDEAQTAVQKTTSEIKEKTEAIVAGKTDDAVKASAETIKEIPDNIKNFKTKNDRLKERVINMSEKDRWRVGDSEIVTSAVEELDPKMLDALSDETLSCTLMQQSTGKSRVEIEKEIEALKNKYGNDKSGLWDDEKCQELMDCLDSIEHQENQAANIRKIAKEFTPEQICNIEKNDSAHNLLVRVLNGEINLAGKRNSETVMNSLRGYA